MSQESEKQANNSEPTADLLRRARRLGVTVKDSCPPNELADRLAARRRQIESLDWGALMDIMSWAKLPVPSQPDKLAVAQTIIANRRRHYQGLSHRGLGALAALRNVKVATDDSAKKIIRRLRRSEGLWGRVLRKRNQWLGSMLSEMIDAERESEAPPGLEESLKPTLQDHIEEKGLIGGLGSGLRGVADGYVREKMEEIEARIDYKLDEIDRRLAEWRNRELTNRLRLIKITLLVSVVIALLSLLYTYLSKLWAS